MTAPVTVFAFAALVLQTGGTRPWPRSVASPGQICVERPGDDGALNIREATVVIEGGPGLVLVGEQAACGFVEAGKHQVWVQSRDPYDSASTDRAAWKSDVLTLTVRATERVELEVCGVGVNGTYKTWGIRPSTGTCRRAP
jgi:hypothetical protein